MKTIEIKGKKYKIKDKDIANIYTLEEEERWVKNLLEIAELFYSKRDFKKLKKVKIEDFQVIAIKPKSGGIYFKMFLGDKEIIDEFRVEE